MPVGAAADPRGKLRAVASLWASGRGGAPAQDAATEAAAAAIAEIEARRGRFRDDTPEIGPDELDAVDLFHALASQWRMHPMAGVRLGIDYAAVPATAAMLGLTMTPELFADLRVMEGAALAAFPRRR
ncbi:MAG TPA: DUF1799 domain-containing protein [Sphingomonas sp.]|nr:DUF1799 domain-containing protein [Sphingomonas sp.]